ncbi:COMPASS (complex proteins associated with Set1p) component [Microbotryomycetes sp. JL221]|nr:COMPASS (complex proteins associated with Set1p) component [Microbotryomycetes sp. JL221]
MDGDDGDEGNDNQAGQEYVDEDQSTVHDPDEGMEGDDQEDEDEQQDEAAEASTQVKRRPMRRKNGRLVPSVGKKKSKTLRDDRGRWVRVEVGDALWTEIMDKRRAMREAKLAAKRDPRPQPKGPPPARKSAKVREARAWIAPSRSVVQPAAATASEPQGAHDDDAVTVNEPAEVMADDGLGDVDSPRDNSPADVRERATTFQGPVFETVLPRDMPLPEPFASYTAPKGDDSEDEDINKAWLNRRRTKGKAIFVNKDTVDGEEQDDRLWCICQSLYDPNRAMICCDKCDSWFHLNCMNITEDRVELVDQFVCPNCEQTIPERTTWKARCCRPTCTKPVALMSKYCSDFCGVEVAAARLELCGVEPEFFWHAVEGARRFVSRHKTSKGLSEADLDQSQSPEEHRSSEQMQLFQLQAQQQPGQPLPLPQQHWVARFDDPAWDQNTINQQQAVDERELARLRETVILYELHERELQDHLELAVARHDLFKWCVRQWELLCTKSAADKRKKMEDGEDKPKRARKDAGPTTAATAICGFDSNVVLDDDQLRQWLANDEGRVILENARRLASVAPESSEEAAMFQINEVDMDEGADRDAKFDSVCFRPKKQCDRHTQWQKLRDNDCELEQTLTKRRIERAQLLRAEALAAIDLREKQGRFLVKYAQYDKPRRTIAVHEYMVDKTERQRQERAAAAAAAIAAAEEAAALAARQAAAVPPPPAAPTTSRNKDAMVVSGNGNDVKIEEPRIKNPRELTKEEKASRKAKRAKRAKERLERQDPLAEQPQAQQQQQSEQQNVTMTIPAASPADVKPGSPGLQMANDLSLLAYAAAGDQQLPLEQQQQQSLSIGMMSSYFAA